ncbi:geranylgeranyl pyrophosphate synthetase [Ophiocordyceps sinensis CO18]|uniref:Geranylgeranyl pyrophosphate synthetase n=1 Tax=Ophiocordyceps sinensis (strain Co18 / CGMCC 3.14243) TaxID=911162 RepID=T5AKC3_OPHSC|nr:geranylgeranyl pyrophosphate synthetase [Ophiocordyceps sinensis CO18]
MCRRVHAATSPAMLSYPTPSSIKRRLRRQAFRDAWIRAGLRGLAPLQRINQDSLVPSRSQVSSASPPEVLCSYNWRNLEAAHIFVPGTPPTWRNIRLPVTLPKDKGVFFIDQNAGRAPKQPLEPLFRAAASTNPDLRFNDIDVVSDRSSLRHLLDFCAARAQEAFRLKLTLVHESLLIERCGKNARERASPRLRDTGWGHNFEMYCTTYPSHMHDSSGHHRVLLYPIGHLRCAVRFEVDACYKKPGSADTGAEVVVPQKNKRPAIICNPESTSTSTQVTSVPCTPDAVIPQSATAEIKTAVQPKGPGTYLQQLWLGRTPWLIVGRHRQGKFRDIEITNVAAEFAEWEKRQQGALQKLVTILEMLRQAVRQAVTRNGASTCVVICERQSKPREIKIFAIRKDRKALPDDLIARFWT